MATVTETQVTGTTQPQYSTLGEVLDYVAHVRPHSFELRDDIFSMIPYDTGALMVMRTDQVILVTGPEAVCYNLPPHFKGTCRVAVSQQSKRAVGGLENQFVVWDLQVKEVLTSFKGRFRSLTAVGISLNGGIGAAGYYDGELQTWDLQTKSELLTLKSASDSAISAIELFETQCIIGNSQGVIQVLSLETGKELKRLQGHTSPVICFKISAEKILFSGSNDKTVRVWRLGNGKELMVCRDYKEWGGLWLLPDGCTCVFQGEEGRINIWNSSDRNKTATLQGSGPLANGLGLFNDNTHLLSVTTKGVIEIWDLQTYSKVMSLTTDLDHIRHMVLTSDNTQVILGQEESVKMWSLVSRFDSMLRISDQIVLLEQAEDRLVIRDSSEQIRLWSFSENQESMLTDSPDKIRFIKMNADRRLLISVSRTGMIDVWNLLSKEKLFTFTEPLNEVLGIALLPDGKQFVSVNTKQQIQLWSLEQKCMLGTVTATSEIQQVEVTPDGKLVVAIGGEGMSFWSHPDLSLVGGIPTADQVMALTRDSRIVVSGGLDKVINMWSIAEKRLLGRLTGHTGTIESLNISGNGRYLISTAENDPARVWSVEDRRCITCMDSIGANAIFSLDSRFIIRYMSEFIFITPLIVPWESLSTGPIQASCELAEIVNQLKQGALCPLATAKTILSPCQVNSLHICAYLNYSERCRDYCTMGVPFLRGQFGSPLTLSLNRRTIKCTDTFLQYLIELVEKTKDDSAWQTFACITDDLPALLTCRSALLKPFFNILMQTPWTDTPLPQFITPTSPLPIVILSDNRLLNIEDFDQSQGNLGSDLVKFNISLIRKNVTPGSSESLEFITALQECDDRTVLATPFVCLLVERKWKYFYPYTLCSTVLYAVMLVVLVMLLFQVWSPVPLCWLFVVLNAVFLSYELAQMMVAGCSYWSDPWNYVDLSRGLLCLLWSGLVLLAQEATVLGEDWGRNVRLMMALMCFLRGFTYFRSFRMTRLFVYMTLAVIKEMYSFLIIMGYSVFAFGVCSSTLVESSTLSGSWISAFTLVLGDFDSSTFTFVEWVIFSCAALINVIIMLNLLVSILGDAFEKTQMSVRENDIYMQLSLIAEYESLMFWRRSGDTKEALISCELDQVAEMTGEWAGLAMELKDAMKDNTTAVTNTLQTAFDKTTSEIVESQKKANEEIGNKLKTMEEMMGEVEVVKGEMKEMKVAMNGMEEKLETILGLLSSRS